MPNVKVKKAQRILKGQQSVNGAVKSICDIMRRSNCAGAMQYVPELTWILFLRILDEKEQRELDSAEALGVPFAPSLLPPYRWRDWASPDSALRRKLQEGALGDLFAFVNGELLPHLRALALDKNANQRQKVIAQVLSSVDRVHIDTETNFLDVLDKVNELSSSDIDPTHVFALSQVYEGLLLKMGEKRNDGGQFFTPREVIRVMVSVLDPQLGKTVYDPCCGTGGFLAQCFEYMSGKLGVVATADNIEWLRESTFYGREKEDLVYPIALANLILHGIDRPNLWHGNALTGVSSYSDLFDNAPALYDYILTNPPFGGKEGVEARTKFAYKSAATQILFLQHVVDSLKPGGKCAIVLDEGTLITTRELAFAQTKRKLLDECDVTCIVSLPAGVFTQAGAGVKTSVIFFRKGTPTEKIWYYDLSDVRVGKKRPLTKKHFEQFYELLDSNGDSERSWTVSRQQIDESNFDLMPQNPNRIDNNEDYTSEQLIDKLVTGMGETATILEALGPPALLA